MALRFTYSVVQKPPETTFVVYGHYLEILHAASLDFRRAHADFAMPDWRSPPATGCALNDTAFTSAHTALPGARPSSCVAAALMRASSVAPPMSTSISV